MLQPHPSLRVLVVDDDPVLTDLLATLLGVLGHAVETASTGHLALQRLAAPQPVDVALLDLRMPAMDGTALAAAIASLPQPPRLIGMSGSAPTRLQAANFAAFLQKPFSIEDLKRALTEPYLRSTAASPPPSEPAVLDAAIYERLAASMPAAQLQELYERTLAYVRQAISRLDVAPATERLEIAHTLQGSCAMVGAMELAHLAALTSVATGQSPGCSLESSDSYKMLRAADRLERILK